MARLSQRERIIQHIQDRYAAEPEHLWARYPNYAVFRQSASRKCFAAVMDVAKKSIDLPGDGTADVMDLKCDPVLVGSLLAQDGFLPAYHMSKSSWISILLDETVPDEQIFPLIELSYDSVAPKRKKP